MKRGFTLAEVLITLAIIGVVAAITMPVLIKKYQQKVTVESLKSAYSILNQAVNMAVSENGDIENWDFSQNGQIFFETYMQPYIKNIKIKNSNGYHGSNVTWSNDYTLANGIILRFYLSKNSDTTKPSQVMIKIDINGNKKPNVLGKDIFAFFIFPKSAAYYNNGLGNCASKVKRGGLYPDGYGFDRDTLLNDEWRGCTLHNNSKAALSAAGKSHGMVGTYCTALIMLDGWKISNDYNW